MSLLSVIMPMRNARRYVGAAVESVLAQADIELELIVVDNVSTDGSAAVVRGVADPRVRLLSCEGRTIAEVFNAGLNAARGTIVARCDADDLYPPGRLAEQAAWLAEHADFGAICGAFESVSASGRRLGAMDCGDRAEEITSELLDGRVRTHFCTYAVRTDTLRRIGGLRTYFVTAEDIDAQLRLAEACRVWFEPVMCYAYRLHDASITHRETSARRLFFEAVAREFQRQRRQCGQDDLQRGCPPAPPAAASPPMRATEHVQSILSGRAWREHRAGRKWTALRTGLRMCLYQPLRARSWRHLLMLLVKPARPRSQSE